MQYANGVNGKQIRRNEIRTFKMLEYTAERQIVINAAIWHNWHQIWWLALSMRRNKNSTYAPREWGKWQANSTK